MDEIDEKNDSAHERSAGASLVLRMYAMPSDLNSNGHIFGGWIMAQVDIAGAVLPRRISKGPIATVAVREFVFKQPVALGDELSFYARIAKVGRTSAEVDVEVFALRDPDEPKSVKVTQATLTYVAIGPDGLPRPFPKIER